MTPAPILARQQLRQAVLNALQSANLGAKIDSPGDWVSQTETIPGILLRSPRSSKEPISRGAPNYTSTITLEMESRVLANTAVDAQMEIEALDAAIEQAVLTNGAFIQLVQQLSIDTETEVTADGRNHFGGTKWTLRCEICEVFDPYINPAVLYSPIDFEPQVTLS
ncbi:hypothetical protein [Undibacterium sp. SXout20W]|uniref:hypothetical protein n=1 Tax=Undibacterium sp. SXout20W TaxID=3413051 RepID=UPI003BF35A2B